MVFESTPQPSATISVLLAHPGDDTGTITAARVELKHTMAVDPITNIIAGGYVCVQGEILCDLVCSHHNYNPR